MLAFSHCHSLRFGAFYTLSSNSAFRSKSVVLENERGLYIYSYGLIELLPHWAPTAASLAASCTDYHDRCPSEFFSLWPAGNPLGLRRSASPVGTWLKAPQIYEGAQWRT